ncbi:DUF6012 family protein, partial [Escherichia coli]
MNNRRALVGNKYRLENETKETAMYLHIVPKLYHRMANKCSLKTISIPELDFIIDSELLSVGR